MWVSAIFFVKKIPKGRQEIKKWFLDSKFQKLPKIHPLLFFEEHVVTALYIGYCFNDPLGMCRQRRQNIVQDACKCVGITKLNENKTGLSAALNHITVQNWTSRSMSQTMEYWWAILPSWVVPNPCRQIATSMPPGLQCQLWQFHFILQTGWVLSKLPKMNIFTGCPLPRLVLNLISYFWP